MNAWRIRRADVDQTTRRWELIDDGDRRLSFDAVVHGWKASHAFRGFWRESLGGVGFDAYAWECPSVTMGIASRAFECVFVASPMLARMPAQPEAFEEHFRRGLSVATFGNLGGDAVLVAPSPGGPGSDFSHLASFNRTAPAGQQDALWHAVGAAMATRIGSKPVWLSTAGLGVAWLHVRLDDRPKYYRHVPYARERV